jgi:hypothetical protein
VWFPESRKQQVVKYCEIRILGPSGNGLTVRLRRQSNASDFQRGISNFPHLRAIYNHRRQHFSNRRECDQPTRSWSRPSLRAMWRRLLPARSSHGGSNNLRARSGSSQSKNRGHSQFLPLIQRRLRFSGFSIYIIHNWHTHCVATQK